MPRNCKRCKQARWLTMVAMLVALTAVFYVDRFVG